MSEHVDLIIIGAGPAGMSAAIAASRQGLSIVVLDEQARPGGQIWRNVEQRRDGALSTVLGRDYAAGAELVDRFRACPADYRSEASVWHIDEGQGIGGGKVFYLKDHQARVLEGRCILLATGAQERPPAFPGWTLPGVMGIGAAQVTLKSGGQIPDGPVWIAGCGPLAYLYAMQLRRAGGTIAGFLDTTPPGRLLPNFFAFLQAMLFQPALMLKGVAWQLALRRTVPWVPHVAALRADGDDRLKTLTYTTAGGKPVTVEAAHLLVHEGIVPGTHPTLMLGCEQAWSDAQDCFAPKLDEWGETSLPGIFVAGDAGGIAGAQAARLRGELAAVAILRRLMPSAAAEQDAVKRLRSRLSRIIAGRAFLDRYFRPREAARLPPNDTVICRCEGVTAAQIRALTTNGLGDPNMVKAFTRAGMGPCQGRQCGYGVARLIAESTGTHAATVGLYRARPPLKPITLGELAVLDKQRTEA